MTVLAAATGVSQLDGEAGQWEHCAEATTASVCDDDGQPRPTSDVVTWLKAHGENPDNGTPESWIVQYMQAHGIPAHIVNGDGTIDAALNASENLIWLVYCDPDGNINGSRHTTHYVRVWGHDGAGVHHMNPLSNPPGQNHVLSDSTFFGNSCGSGIQVDKVLASDNGGDDMASPYTINCWMMDVKSLYGGYAGRRITNDERLYYEALYSTPDFNPAHICDIIMDASDAGNTSIGPRVARLESQPPSGLTLDQVKAAIAQSKITP